MSQCANCTAASCATFPRKQLRQLSNLLDRARERMEEDSHD